MKFWRKQVFCNFSSKLTSSVDSDSSSEDIFVSDPEDDSDENSADVRMVVRRRSTNRGGSVDNDDEFFDAVSQQMYSSTLVLDFNENEHSAYSWVTYLYEFLLKRFWLSGLFSNAKFFITVELCASSEAIHFFYS